MKRMMTNDVSIPSEILRGGRMSLLALSLLPLYSQIPTFDLPPFPLLTLFCLPCSSSWIKVGHSRRLAVKRSLPLLLWLAKKSHSWSQILDCDCFWLMTSEDERYEEGRLGGLLID